MSERPIPQQRQISTPSTFLQRLGSFFTKKPEQLSERHTVFDDHMLTQTNGPEGERVSVKQPLIRGVKPEITLTILSQKQALNAPSGETYFFCTMADIPGERAGRISYSEGMGELGFFVLFPNEANKKKLTWKKFGFYGSHGDVREIVVDSRDQSASGKIPYEEYLFLPPQQYNTVAACQSITEAEGILKQAGFDREWFEQEVCQKITQLLQMRSDIEALFCESDNPPVTTVQDVITLYKQNPALLDNQLGNEAWIQGIAQRDQRNLEKLRMEPDKEQKRQLLRTTFPRLFTEGYVTTERILSFLQKRQSP